MYSDFSVLKSGKHKGKMLFEVPADWLLSVLENYHPNNKQADMDLIEYIQKNKDLIPHREQKALEVIHSNSFCRKAYFPTKKDATFELNRIRSKSQTQKDHKIPVRAYECEFCSAWHLTSESYEEWKAKQKLLTH